MAQLKKERTWAKGIPWRTLPDLSITRWMIEEEMELEICEKSSEREGIVNVGVGLGSGLGFRRWCSLINEWSFSAIRVSSGDKEADFPLSM